MRDPHEIVAARQSQKAGQIFNIVLVRLHVIGVAAVAAHADTCQLAHEVILQPRPGDLAGIVEVLRADEAHNRIYQEGGKMPGKAVAPGLHGHLVRVKMGIAGKLRPLSRLKIKHIGPFCRTPLEHQRFRLLQRLGRKAEGLVALLAPGNGLEDEIAGSSLLHRLHLGRHMSQYADLGGDVPVLLDLLKAPEYLRRLFRRVRHRIQAQDSVPGPKAQPLQQGGGNALRVIGGVVGLQAAAQRSRQADGGIAVGCDPDLVGRINKVQVSHELAHRRHHLRGQPPAEAADVCPGGALVQDPLPQVRNGPALDPLVLGLVQVILDEPRHLVFFIGYRRIFTELLQGHPGQHHLGRHPLLGGFGGEARQLVSGFFLVGLGQHLLQIPEHICFSQEGGL